jgi:single-strand selective monofunctional uracil DNA glycosylase
MTKKKLTNSPTADDQLHDVLIAASEQLCENVDQLVFAEPITHVYNPLDYARQLHHRYIAQASASARVLMLGMNPGPWGMAQTGVPFGEVAAVRDWMGLRGEVSNVNNEHPKRPIEGLSCERSEVSGRRLWGLMQDRFPDPIDFFQEHYVMNYCPLVFMESSGRNRTPDKLPSEEVIALQTHCDQHLREVIAALPWTHLVGVGAYAEACFRRVVEGTPSPASICRILHPSPASPAANRDWAGTATQQLKKAGVW